MLPTSNRLEIDFDQFLQLTKFCLHHLLTSAKEQTQLGAGDYEDNCLETPVNAGFSLTSFEYGGTDKRGQARSSTNPMSRPQVHSISLTKTQIFGNDLAEPDNTNAPPPEQLRMPPADFDASRLSPPQRAQYNADPHVYIRKYFGN